MADAVAAADEDPLDQLRDAMLRFVDATRADPAEAAVLGVEMVLDSLRPPA